MPVFLSCLKILDCLDFSDLEEVRHYRDPPIGVVTVMNAICLLFNHPPGWDSARLLLRRLNFFQVSKKVNVILEQIYFMIPQS